MSPPKSPLSPMLRRPLSPLKNQKSPSRPVFEAQSAEYDIIDPIYHFNDPIAKSVKLRKNEGSMMSVVKEKKEQYFYKMKLIGTGLTLSEVTLRKSISPKKILKKILKENESAGSLPRIKGDPIGDSIRERKMAGSPL